MCEIITKKWCVVVLHPRSRRYFNILSQIHSSVFPKVRELFPKVRQNIPKMILWENGNMFPFPKWFYGNMGTNVPGSLVFSIFWWTRDHVPISQMMFWEYENKLLFPKCSRTLGNGSSKFTGTCHPVMNSSWIVLSCSISRMISFCFKTQITLPLSMQQNQWLIKRWKFPVVSLIFNTNDRWTIDID